MKKTESKNDWGRNGEKGMKWRKRDGNVEGKRSDVIDRFGRRNGRWIEESERGGKKKSKKKKKQFARWDLHDIRAFECRAVGWVGWLKWADLGERLRWLEARDEACLLHWKESRSRMAKEREKWLKKK